MAEIRGFMGTEEVIRGQRQLAQRLEQNLRTKSEGRGQKQKVRDCGSRGQKSDLKGRFLISDF